MNLPLISQLPQDLATAVLIVGLLIVFVIAFKVMKMVFSTVVIAGVSAGFYASLTYLTSLQFSFSQMLSYALLGSILYLVYSFLASALWLTENLLKIPYSILKTGLDVIRKLSEALVGAGSSLMERINGERNNDGKSEPDGSSGNTEDSDTKEVVVEKLKEQD
jgi:hypothetical protein